MADAAAWLWASPWTALGLLLGLLALRGGGYGRHGRVVEFWGGGLDWLLEKAPLFPRALAITFGHAVLARSRAVLELSRSHEAVHVRQYERWGPLFVPAYLLCGLWLRLRGRDPYRDNPFEREAFGSGR